MYVYNIYTCMHVHACVYMCARARVQLCMHVCACVYAHVCGYEYVHVTCVYICTSIVIIHTDNVLLKVDLYTVCSIYCRYHLGSNQDQRLVLFEGHVVIEEKVASKIINAKSFSSSTSSASLAEDYSVIVDGSKIGKFFTHFWRSTGFWCVI